MIWNGLLLLILFLAPGYGAWLAFGQGLRDRLSAIEALFLMLITGLLLAMLPALILAQIGFFSMKALIIVLAVFTLIAAGWAVFKRGTSPNPFRGLSFEFADLLPFLLLGLAFLLSPSPFEYIVGGRDHGIYVNTGIHIARSGEIIIRDPELAALPAETRLLLTNPNVSVDKHGLPGPWSEGQRLAGLTIRDGSAGTILPHGFHLFPVLIAIFYSAGGVAFALGTTMVLALLGSIAIYFAGRRLFGFQVALLTLFLITLNVGQMWFVRYPAAEILTRMLFWSGLLCASLMFSGQSRMAAVVAGASFGFMHLAKLDTITIFIVLVLFFAYLWLRRRWQRHYWYFIVTYLLLFLLSLIHGYFVATIYFIDQTTRELLPSFLANRLIDAATDRPEPMESLGYLATHNAGLIILGLIVAAVLLLIAVRFRSHIDQGLGRIGPVGRPVKTVIVITLAFLALYGIFRIPFLPPDLLPASKSSFTLISWYLTPLGLILGLIGFIQFILSSKRDETNLAWLLLVVSALPLLLLGSLTTVDHFWAVRRYVPIVIPALLMFAANVLWQLMPAEREKWIKAVVPLGLGALLVLGMWQDTFKVLGVVEYAGLTEQLEELFGKFPQDAVLLLDESDAANRLALPLWLIWDKTVFTVSKESMAQQELTAAFEEWSSAGRDVFWLSADGSEPVLNAAIVSNQLPETNISLPLIELTIGSIPHQAVELKYIMNAHQLMPSNESG